MYESNTNPIERSMLGHRVLERAEVDGLLARFRELADQHGPQSRPALRVRDTIITHNLKLVAMMAGRYQLPRGMERSDLIGYGTFGLIQAVERFELSRGVQFSTYATFWIRHAIGRAIADYGATIRVPVHAQGVVRQEEQSADNEPDAKANRTAADARAARKLVSMDAPMKVGDAESTRLGDVIGDDTDSALDRMIAAQETERVAAAVEQLPERLRGVVHARLQERTLAEVGRDFEEPKSRERVRQLQEQAFDMMRRELRTA